MDLLPQITYRNVCPASGVTPELRADPTLDPAGPRTVLAGPDFSGGGRRG
jgi:hypothetical protein